MSDELLYTDGHEIKSIIKSDNIDVIKCSMERNFLDKREEIEYSSSTIKDDEAIIYTRDGNYIWKICSKEIGDVFTLRKQGSACITPVFVSFIMVLILAMCK